MFLVVTRFFHNSLSISLKSKSVLAKSLILFLLVFSAGVAQAKPPYKVIAYLATSYVGNSRGTFLSPANVPWSDITSLYAFAADVNSNATITYSPLGGDFSLLSTAHSPGNNTRVYLTVGGASSASNFSSSTNSPANITSLVNSIMNVVITGDGVTSYDGVDIDWEFPAASEKTQFMSFMQQLSAALRAQPPSSVDGLPLGIDFFASAGFSNCGVDWTTISSYSDYAIISGYALSETIGGIDYDGPMNVPAGTNLTDCGGHTDPFSVAGQATRLVSLGFPRNQLIIGCPLYVNGSTDIYTVLQSGTLVSYHPTEMEAVYNTFPSNSADDTQSFCDKISFTLAQGMPGIALFELSQACPATDAPVATLWNVINGSSCVVLPTATFTPTATSTPTATATNTQCLVGGVPCTSTATPTATNSPTITPTQTVTPTVIGVTVPLVYPNPTSGQPVNLRLPITVTTDVKVQIFTVAFRKVWEQDYSQVQPATPISVSLNDQTGTQLSNGLYYVVAITSKGTFKSKLLILR